MQNRTCVTDKSGSRYRFPKNATSSITKITKQNCMVYETENSSPIFSPLSTLHSRIAAKKNCKPGRWLIFFYSGNTAVDNYISRCCCLRNFYWNLRNKVVKLWLRCELIIIVVISIIMLNGSNNEVAFSLHYHTKL